ncbi:MAG: YihY/virulence factor BrkB family protein [Gemmatimonadaceae bacterium]|nr:YihY/virulence factor BrkB family protein [Gemmatimonadaceae bacterium]
MTALRGTADAWWDVVRRIWKQSEEDNVLFLAGGLAFNVLLALVPFVLLLISGIALLLGRAPDDAVHTVTGLLQAFLPNNTPSAIDLLNSIVSDVLRTRGAVTLYAAIGFAWFSTRLFGSLRSVLALIFDGTDRGIVVGKLFDFGATIVATMAVVVYIAMSAYLDLATTQGVQLLMRMGLRESAMGELTYVTGRLIAISIVFSLFYAMYHGLPRRRPLVRTALTAAAAASLLFEIARHVFAILVRQFDPSSLYTGTIAVIVAVVFWTYYGALLFLIGGEIAQAVELRRVELIALDRNVPLPTAGKTPVAKTASSRTPTPPPSRKSS